MRFFGVVLSLLVSVCPVFVPAQEVDDTFVQLNSFFEGAKDKIVLNDLEDLSSPVRKYKCLAYDRREKEFSDIRIGFVKVVVPGGGPLFPDKIHYTALGGDKSGVSLKDLREIKSQFFEDSIITKFPSDPSYHFEIRKSDKQLFFVIDREIVVDLCPRDPDCFDTRNEHVVTLGYCF